MAVSKRLRYEILRRDNHACRYCGATAPGVALTVDHVVPVALGGSDDPDNLVAACVACNSGKSATPPGAPLVDDVAADALRWARAIRHSIDVMHTDLASTYKSRAVFDECWRADLPWSPRPDDWPDSIDRFITLGLSELLVLDCLSITVRRRIHSDGCWRYFCGIAWKRLKEVQDAAHEVVSGQDVE